MLAFFKEKKMQLQLTSPRVYFKTKRRKPFLKNQMPKSFFQFNSKVH